MPKKYQANKTKTVRTESRRSEPWAPIWGLLLAILLVLPLGLSIGCRGEDGASGTTTIQQTDYISEPLAEVTGQISVPEDTENWGILVFAEGTSYMAMTNRRGEFRLSGLPPGNYILRAIRNDLEPLLLADILVRPQDTEAAQPYLTLEPSVMQGGFGIGSGGSSHLRAGSVRGRVLTTNPPDSQEVVVEIPGTGLTTRTDSGGAYFLDNVPAGEYALRFSKSDYATLSRNIEVAAFRETTVPDVRLELVDASSVVGRSIVGTVRLRTPDGQLSSPPEGARVSLEGTNIQAPVDASGGFQLRGMEAAAYVITASAPGHSVEQRFRVDLSEIPVGEVDLVLTPQDDPADLLGSVMGRIALADTPGRGTAGIVVSLAGTGLITTTSATGDYQIPSVEPGVYTLVATLNGYEPGVLDGIEVPEGSVVRLGTLTLEPEIEAPTVVATRPLNNATDVTIEDPTVVVIVFDRPMDPSTLRDAVSVSPSVDFSVALAGEHPLAGDDRMVILLEGYGGSTGSALRFDRRYTVTVASSATSREGAQMEENFALNFTTGSGKIVATDPADGSSGAWIYPARPIRVLFNISIDPESLDSSTVRIRPDIGSVPNLSIVNNPQNGWSTMNITGVFRYDTEYEVSIRGRVRSLGGQAITNVPYTFKFRTTSASEGFEAFAPTDQRSRRDRLEEERRRR